MVSMETNKSLFSKFRFMNKEEMICRNTKREFTGIEPNSVGLIGRQTKRISEDDIVANRDDSAKTFETEKEKKTCLTKRRWENDTRKRFETADIQRRVQELMCQENAKLRVRQERLRDLLRSEECMYLTELSQTQETLLDRQRKQKQKADWLASRREAERIAFVQEKYEQQFRENSEELRSIIHSDEKRSIAQEYKEQIRQRREVENLKLEEEKVFLTMWSKDMEAKERKEEEDRMKKLNDKRNTDDVLMMQIAESEAKKKQEKLIKAEELKQLEEEKRQIELENERLQEAKRKKRLEMQDEYRKSALYKNEKRNSTRQTVQPFDMVLIKRSDDDGENNNLKKAEKKRELRHEQEHFMKYLTFIKDEKLKRNRQEEQIFKEEADKIWQKRADAWRKEKEEKKKVILEFSEERKKQIKERFEQKSKLRGIDEEGMAEVKRQLEENKKLMEEEREKLQQKRQNYKNTLIGQINYNKRVFEDNLSEERRMLEAQAEAERQYLAKIEDMKGRPLLKHLHPLRRPGCISKQPSFNGNACNGDIRFFRSGTLN